MPDLLSDPGHEQSSIDVAVINVDRLSALASLLAAEHG